MKNKKIEFIKTHVSYGVLAGGSLTLESNKHKLVMTLTPAGVYVETVGHGEFLVTFNNITHIKFSKEEA